MNLELALRALSNERRLRILDWLRSPRRHFPPQVDGDLIKDGVCGLLIARKLRVTQPTASEHTFSRESRAGVPPRSSGRCGLR